MTQFEIRNGHGDYLSRLSGRGRGRLRRLARLWSSDPAAALTWHLRRDAEKALKEEFAAWEIARDQIAVEDRVEPSVHHATKKPKASKKTAKQLDREIGEVLAKRNGNGNGAMERVTRERVHEALIGEQITRREPIEIMLAGIPEAWDLIFTVGKNYGGARAGRILIVLPKGGVADPLAGLAYAVEYGRPYVHHIWVDSDARGRGLSQVLFDAYRSEVSSELVVMGPFTKAGRAAAERAGATLIE